MADIAGNQEGWKFIQPREIPAGAASFSGDLNFKQGLWQMAAAAMGGQVFANGKVGNDDWRLALENISLQQLLAARLPSAPRGEGKISAKMIVINNSARGELTAKNLELPALNLSATDKLATNSEIQNQNLRQAGKIDGLKAALKWQNDQIWLDAVQTEGPVGYGKVRLDGDKKEWSGEWQGSGARVTIDGPVNSAFVQTHENISEQKRK